MSEGAEEQLDEGTEDSAEGAWGLEEEVILPAEKGNATVMMRRCDYTAKTNWLF